ncbi:beta-2-microglobulin [Paralichthys olivaceus]|uniref:Beta-2-microglobulin n=2 Tax=Paralichthys olivaceus TaxID=8255 RepID=B2MG_PAROL|nr:RecName: Full=Beta-2-microglobulin; Flags: Precursor [Paralichthys olivaceus]AAN40738.1 beta-2 microglobulin [Paralichthys olivaceus]ACZ58352.1 beta-2-microglobulin precursor [Paralichthys olivaceus]
MGLLICSLLLGLLCCSMAKDTPPKVEVYTREPEEFGKPNSFICHVSGFYPPQINITLLKDGKEIPNTQQTDLAFEANWYYYLTKHVSFTPKEDDEFICRVTHMGKSKDHFLMIGL